MIKHEKRILGVAWITLYLMGTDLFVISPLLPLMARHFQCTPAVMGWSMTVFSIAYAFLAPVFGHIGDGRGRKLPLVGGLLVFGVANGVTAWAPNFRILLLSRFIAGGAAAAITPTVYAAISDLAPAQRRGTWLSFVGSGIFTALWSSAPLGSLMGYRWGWYWVFIILAILPFPLSGSNAWILRHSVPMIKTVPKGGYRRLLLHVSATALWAIAVYSTYLYLGAGLLTAGGYAPRQVAAAVAAFGAGMVAGILSGGHLADRWGPQRVTALGCFGVALGAVIFRFTLTYFALALGTLFFFAFSAGFYFSSFQVFLAHQHSQRRGAALAWNNSSLYMGITVGSFFGGLALSHQGFYANLMLSACVGIGASAWAYYVQRPANGIK